MCLSSAYMYIRYTWVCVCCVMCRMRMSPSHNQPTHSAKWKFNFNVRCELASVGLPSHFCLRHSVLNGSISTPFIMFNVLHTHTVSISPTISHFHMSQSVSQLHLPLFCVQIDFRVCRRYSIDSQTYWSRTSIG